MSSLVRVGEQQKWDAVEVGHGGEKGEEHGLTEPPAAKYIAAVTSHNKTIN